MKDLLQITWFALIPAGTMILGGAWASWRAPRDTWRSALMHFAAGVIFAVVAVELIPDLVHDQSVPATVAGFLLGMVAMLGVRTWSERGSGSAVSGALVAATAVDLGVDGLMLGVGFTAGAKEGVLLTIALALELVTLGLAVASELAQGKLARGPILLRVGCWQASSS